LKKIESQLEKKILISNIRNKADQILENLFLAVVYVFRKVWDFITFEFTILPKRFGKWTHKFWLWFSRRIDIFFEKMRQKRFGKKVEKY
jgi:hypothetical protein